jgi:hypothetical protein
MAIAHFIEEFPSDALMVLAPIVRNRTFAANRVEAGEAALAIQSYAMGRVLGTKHEQTMFGAGPPISEDDHEAVLSRLESFVADNPHLANEPGQGTAKRAAKARVGGPPQVVGAIPFPAVFLLRWVTKIILEQIASA